MTKRTRNRIEQTVLPLFAAAVVLALWHYAVKVSGTAVFPSPARVLAAFKELVATNLLVTNVRSSLERVLAGYFAAALIGLPLGVLMGVNPKLTTAVNPVVQFLRPISP